MGPSDWTSGWLPDPPRLSPSNMLVFYPLSSADFLVLGITYISRVPHGSALDLFGIRRSNPVWSVDRHPPPSATTTLNETNTGPSYLRFAQETPHDMMYVWQPPALRHQSGYEEETLTGTLIPRSVHSVDTFEGLARQILNSRIQGTVFIPNHGAGFARDESLLEHYRAKRGEFTTTCEVASLVRGRLHEACLLEYPSPCIPDKNVPAALATDNLNAYNQDWSPWVCYYSFAESRS